MCMIGKQVRVLRAPKEKPIRAYRVWWVSPEGEAESVAQPYIWVSGPNRTTPPVSRGATGFWAYKERRWALVHGAGHPHYSTGLVLLWGKVYEHQTGYRAEYAQWVRKPRRRGTLG